MCGRVVCMVVFFFQAEDGIRDLVRSRGLGDVYKRQVDRVRDWMVKLQRTCTRFGNLVMEGRDIGTNVFPETEFKFYLDATPVSYTHLTLPTSDLV